MMNNEATIIAGYMDAHLGSALSFQFGRYESKDWDYMDGYHMGRTEGILSQYLAVGALDVEGYLNLNVRKCFQ